MKRSRIVPGVRAGLLLAGSLAAGAAAPAAAVELDIEDGLVTIDATDVPQQEILDAIANRRGIRLVQQAALTRRVSIHADRQPLASVLDELLGTSDSYLLFLPAAAPTELGRPRIPGTLWVFAAGTGYGLDFLESVLLRGEPGERKEAVRVLGKFATPAAVRTLALALGDDDGRIRRAAIETLAAIGSDEALAALASAALAGEPATRAAAAESLGAAGGASARAYLHLALEDEDPRPRAAALEALGDLGGDLSRARIERALSDPNPYVRERALDIIEELDDEALFHALYPPQP